MIKLIRYTFLFLFVLLPVVFYAQDSDDIEFFPVLSTADIDKDGVLDSLWYNCGDSILTIKLSTDGFFPMTIYYDQVFEFGDCGDVQAYEGGFVASAPHMRSMTLYSYEYELENRTFRMSGFFHEHYQSGSMSLDLLEGRFTGNWAYYEMDYETDSLIFIDLPEVEFYVHHKPVYIDEDQPDFIGLGYDLMNMYDKIYSPPVVDTVRFVELTCDFDYCDFIYKNLEGKIQSGTEACNHEYFYRDDLLEIAQSVFFYQEPGDGSYQARWGITDAKVIEAGKIRSFFENKKKEINFYNSSAFHENIGINRDDAVYYFFAANKDKVIHKYMNKPGSLDVYVGNINKEAIWRDEWQYCFRITIFNNHKNKRKLIREVLLAITDESEFLYYLYDEKKVQITSMDIE